MRRQSLPHLRLLVTFVSLIVVLTACDFGGSGTEEEDDHEFTLDISPTAAKTLQKVTTSAQKDTVLNGYSFFRDPSPTQTVRDADPFLLYLNENETLEERRNQEGLLGFAYSQGGLPSTQRTYPFAETSSEEFQNGEAFKFIMYYDYQKTFSGTFDTLGYYNSIGGSISFRTAHSDLVVGSVDAKAEAVQIIRADSTLGYDIRRDTVDVEGEFHARNAERFLPAPSGSPGPYSNQ